MPMSALASRLSNKKTTQSENMAAEAFTPLAFRHFASAQTKFEIPLIANGNAYLGDVYSRYEKSPWLCRILRHLVELRETDPLQSFPDSSTVTRSTPNIRYPAGSTGSLQASHLTTRTLISESAVDVA